MDNLERMMAILFFSIMAVLILVFLGMGLGMTVAIWERILRGGV